MKWNLAAGLFALLVVELHAPPPADACGIKLTVKSQMPRKAVTRTANPSDVLLLGDPPRRLERDLAAAGHRVEVAQKPGAARRKSYGIVVADSGMLDEARSSFSTSIVVVRSSDVAADMRSVERQVARKPVKTDEGRTVVAARAGRTPIAAGPAPDPSRRVVAAKEPAEAPIVPPPAPAPAPAPAPVPERIATTVPRPPVPEVNPAPPPEPRAVAKVKTPPGEVYFPYGSYKLGNPAKIALASTVRWLTDKSDVQVIIEGHADPTGNPDDNMRLAQRRAELVRDHLVSSGIDQSRIEVVSFGDTRLKYGRTDYRNRRAAIVAK